MNELESHTGGRPENEVLDPGQPNANGHHPRYATADEILMNAPKDIVEKDVTDVFGGLTVRVRGLTAAQAAHVKQQSFQMQGRSAEVAWAMMERTQFELGVIEPKFTHEQVIMLHRTSGPSFNKIIQTLDDISGIGKETLREAQKEFQGRGEDD
jgi:hypothetical protein